MGRNFYTRRQISYLLLSRDCRQTQVQVRLLHRYRRIHQVLRVQQVFEVTKGCQGTGAIHLEFKIKSKGQQGGSRRPLRYLSEWVEEFTENLEDTVVPASANISHVSDS